MTALAILLKFWPYIAGAIGLGFGALKWRSSIIKAERAKQAASEAKARDISDEIDDAVAGRSPDDNRGRLKGWSAR